MRTKTRQQKRQLTSVTAVALITLVACGTESGAGGGTVRAEQPVTDVRWSIESVTVDGRKTAGGRHSVLEIGSRGKTFLSTGCADYEVDVTVHDNTVTVGKKRQTAIADCTVDLTPLDQALGEAFAGTLKAAVKGDDLSLVSADGDAIALTTGPPPPLTGTKWIVDALVGEGRSTPVPTGTEGKAYLTLGKDGSVEGSLGCNSFHGSAEVSGTTVTFGRLTSTRKLCSGPVMTVERATQRALEGEVTYDLHHGGLTLTSPDDSGISALAG